MKRDKSGNGSFPASSFTARTFPTFALYQQHVPALVLAEKVSGCADIFRKNPRNIVDFALFYVSSKYRIMKRSSDANYTVGQKNEEAYDTCDNHGITGNSLCRPK